MLIGLCLITSFAPSAAAHAARADVFIGPDISYINYREFDRNGHELDREEGALPGIRATIRSTSGRLFVRADLAYHGGQVDYDGQTQGGRPVQSDTDTQRGTLAADIGYWLGQQPDHWGVFLHLARRRWDRDIQSTSNATGIEEIYRWSEVGLGLRHVWAARAGGWRQELQATVLRTTAGTIDIKLSDTQPGLDDQTLDLGDRTGLRLRYTASHSFGDLTLRIEPYFAYWAFGRSNTERITAGGAPTNFLVTEPRSESLQGGIAIGLAF